MYYVYVVPLSSGSIHDSSVNFPASQAIITPRSQTTIRTTCVLSKEMDPRQQLEAVYDEHADALFAFLLNLVRNEEQTREVLQELFRKIARQPERLKPARDQRSFLIRMAHHLAIDLIRRRDTRKRHHDQFQAECPQIFAAADDPDESAFRQALSVGLAELPPDQRAVVHLKLWEGFTFEQIANALDIPLNTAASRHRYGLDKLRTLLRPLYDEIK